MGKIICWLFGHNWKVTHIHIRKSISLAGLHPLAGKRAICKRCCAVFDDLPFEGIDTKTGWTMTDVVAVKAAADE